MTPVSLVATTTAGGGVGLRISTPNAGRGEYRGPDVAFCSARPSPHDVPVKAGSVTERASAKTRRQKEGMRCDLDM